MTAMAFPEAVKGGDRKSSCFKQLDFKGFDKSLLSRARYVLRNNPPASNSGIPLSARSSHSMSRIHPLGFFPFWEKLTSTKQHCRGVQILHPIVDSDCDLFAAAKVALSQISKPRNHRDYFSVGWLNRRKAAICLNFSLNNSRLVL